MLTPVTLPHNPPVSSSLLFLCTQALTSDLASSISSLLMQPSIAMLSAKGRGSKAKGLRMDTSDGLHAKSYGLLQRKA